MSDYVSPQFDSIALITIDMQRDVLDGQEQEVVGTSAAAKVAAQLRDAFHRVGAPIVHVVRLYREDGSNADACRRGPIEAGLKLVIAGSPGAEIAEGLVPQGVVLDTELLLAGKAQELGPNEVAIYKPRWGAFYDTPLEGHLRRLGVSSLAFCGCNFPNCPRTSIYEASERDFRVVVAEDAVSGLYDRGRDELRAIGATLMTGEEIAASLPHIPGHGLATLHWVRPIHHRAVVTATASDDVVLALGSSKQVVAGPTREPIWPGAATELVMPWAAD